MYEKDGEQYFIVDGHTHFWNASPENRNKWGEGFIACFYDYHRNLSPEEYVWDKDKYDRYSEEDMIHDLFEIGYVDKAIMQPTYLKEFFPGGFNTTEQDAAMAANQGARVVSSSGHPVAILAMLDATWKSSPSASAQPVRLAISAATVLLPHPETPITTSCIGRPTTNRGSAPPSAGALATVFDARVSQVPAVSNGAREGLQPVL